MKLETKNGRRIVTLSKRERLILSDAASVLSDLDSVNELSDAESKAREVIGAVIVRYSPDKVGAA